MYWFCCDNSTGSDRSDGWLLPPLLRALAAITALFCALASPNSSAAQNENDLPYLAEVIEDGTPIHSGPAEVHYPTEELAAREQVEVYRHDPDGWCAIRPHADSFSMVLAEDIVLLSDSVAQIVNAGTKCWVGTHFDEVDRPLFQIRLNKGEKLKLLGKVREQYELDPDQPDWIQVAPPAGEFRWIHRSRIRRLNQPIARSRRTGERLGSPFPSAAQQADPTPSPEVDDRTVFSELNPYLGNEVTADWQSHDSSDRSTNLANRSAFEPTGNKPTSPDDFDIVDTRDLEPSTASVSSFGGAAPSTQTRSPSDIDRNVNSDTAPRITDGVSGWRAVTGRPPQERFASLQPTGVSGNLDTASVQPPDAQPDRPDLPDSRGQRQGGISSEPTIAVPQDDRPLPPFNLSAAASDTILQLETMLTREVAKPLAQARLEPIITQTQDLMRQTVDLNIRQQLDRILAKALKFRDVQVAHELSQRAGSTQLQRFDSARYLPLENRSSGLAQGLEAQAASSPNGQQLASDPASTSAATTSNPNTPAGFESVGILNQLVRNHGRSQPTYVLQNEDGKILQHVAPAPGVNLHRYLRQKVGIKGQLGFNQQLELPHITAEQVIPIRR